MIAKVIVNHNSKEVDKLYDYLIPEELEGEIGIGSRVLVHFGRGNQKKEAYVFRISENTRAGKLKSIDSVVEGGRVFDEKMLELICWMRERYLSSYIEILRVIIPAGISIKSEEWVVPKKDCKKDLTPSMKKVLDFIEERGGECELSALIQGLGSNARPTVLKMCKEEILIKEFRDAAKIKDKTLRVASIDIDREDAEEEIKNLNKKRAFAQAKMLEILVCNEFLAVSDLVKFTQSSYNAVSALEKKGLIKISEINLVRDPFRKKIKKTTESLKLTDEQKNAAEAIDSAIEQEEYKGILLHGVTGSGKTRVYMDAISKVIARGKKAILLVPEISLTPQMVEQFVGRFGDRIAVFHSGLSLGEKYDQWKRMRDGDADIAIGARSAVFAPFDNIGIIIMDEEHEQTYKSEMAPRYNTREVAKTRAVQNKAVLLLASATPDVESYYKALSGEYTLITMKNRTNSKPLPGVSVVDMKKELEAGNKSIFSRELISEIKSNLENKEQTILFLNRRGFSTFVSCRSCGYVAKCPDCNISLTYHKYSDTLRCHYCGHTRENPKICPECGSGYIRYFGGGTQRVEEEIKNLFPDASVIRMDVDTTTGKFAHEKIIEKFKKDHIDILIGTQMVTKGLDFENVTLVGVVSADVILNLDDYRSAERSFSVLEQVSGRAGRAEKPGRAIVQTYTPEHSSIVYMKKHNYEEFYKSEIAMRYAMCYPPFCEMVVVMFSSASETLVGQAARFFAKNIINREAINQSIKVLGPIPAALSKIKNKYRWQMVIKCENADRLNGVLEDARNACLKNSLYSKVTVVIDKSPQGIV